MASLKELLAQRAKLEEEIAQTQNAERAEVVARVKRLMDEHGLTLADLSAGREGKGRKTKTSTVAPKFRNKATGDTWSGRGLQPKWLKAAIDGGAKLDDFRI